MPQPNNHSTLENPVGRFMVAVGAIIENSLTGKILIIRRADHLDWRPGEWEIDYGRIDQHEDPETGLKRELGEETGLKNIKIKKILSVWHMYRGPKSVDNDLIGITFYCQTTEDRVDLSDEHSQYKWVTPVEALGYVEIDGIKRDIKEFIKIKNTH